MSDKACQQNFCQKENILHVDIVMETVTVQDIVESAIIHSAAAVMLLQLFY